MPESSHEFSHPTLNLRVQETDGGHAPGFPMYEFATPDPNMQILGASLLKMAPQLRLLGIDDRLLTPIQTRYGLLGEREDGWYPMQACLEYLTLVASQLGPRGLKALGRSVPRNTKFPPEIRTLDRALKTLDVAYHMNHRGNNIGGYLCELRNPGMARLHCDSPYGCVFDQGLLEGLFERFGDPAQPARFIHMQERGCRDRGASTCIFQIAWPAATP